MKHSPFPTFLSSYTLGKGNNVFGHPETYKLGKKPRKSSIHLVYKRGNGIFFKYLIESKGKFSERALQHLSSLFLRAQLNVTDWVSG